MPYNNRRADRATRAATSLTRRALLGGATVLALVPDAGPRAETTGWQDGDATPPTPEAAAQPRFLTEAEHRFLAAAADRLIPPDATGPGAVEAGVIEFIDHQLAGPFGLGAHFYLGGPSVPGTPSQGYQTALTPAAVFRTAIDGIERHVRGMHGAAFASLAPAVQDDILRALEAGLIPLPGINGPKLFFALLLRTVREGYFSDPVYGGNGGMADDRLSRRTL